MSRQLTFLTLAVAGLISLPISAHAVQAVLFDGAVSHTSSTGATVAIGASGAPADFTAPDNFAAGTLHHRLVVTTAQANATTYAVCFVQGGERACSTSPIAINGTGTFDASQGMTSLDNGAAIDWSAPLDDLEVVAMDAAGVPVDASETTWVGSPDFDLYYPLQGTYQAVVVAMGDTFEGFPGDAPGDAAEAPTFNPNGGTFEGSVQVRLATDSDDATIYYTTNGSDPTDASTEYGGAFTLDETTTVRAIAYEPGLDPSPVESATFTIVDQLTSGLRGRYFDSTNFRGLVATRTDPVIDFTWEGGQPPFGDLGGDYSILWSGQVTPRYSDQYTFKTVNDDGVRLYVNNELVIDDWNDHGPQERTGTITLQANQPAAVWLEYYNGGGGARISLSWESAQQSEELIPEEALVPGVPAGTQPVVSLFGGDVEVFEATTDPVVLQLRRRGSLDGALTVNLEVTGDATPGADYVLDSTTVQFDDGQLSARIEVTILDDDEVEGPESFTIAIADGSGYVVGNPNDSTITILDDDVLVDSIAGEILYSGTESGNIIVEAFRETDPVFAKRRVSLLNPGPYQFLDLEEGSYTVVAYIDANDDEQLSEGETWGIYEVEGRAALVTVPPGQIGIDINLDVPPGTTDETDDDGGCCATVNGADRGNTGWAALLVGVAMLALRRRRL